MPGTHIVNPTLLQGPCRQTWRREGCPPLPHHLVCVEKFILPYLTLLHLDLHPQVIKKRFMAGRAQRNMAGAEAARAVHNHACESEDTRGKRGTRERGSGGDRETKARRQHTPRCSAAHRRPPIAVAAPRMQSRAGKVEG